MSASFRPLTQVSVILCHPRHPGNIGAAARAMGNFGACDLRLVDACPHLHPEAHKFAAHAAPLLGSAGVYPDLAAALDGLDLTIATTRRGGRRRGALLDCSELPALLAALSSESRVGLVFGSEEAGLSSAELALCNHAACIATSDGGLGSLNLGQAVLLFLYELARTRHYR